MFLDLAVKSHGTYAVYATYAGSYGELVRQRKGRAYTNFPRAIAQAKRLIAGGARDVEIVNTHSRRTYFFGEGS